MKPTTSGGGYHPLTPDSEGSVRDAKGASVRDVGERVVFHQSAILSDRKVAPASNVAPSKLQTEWAKAPTQVSLVQGMQLAAEIDRVTGTFSVFVQAACPSLSGAKFAKAVKNIALLAPTHSLDTDEQAVAYMTNFLPPPEVWKNDGLTPKARADHLMGVLTRCQLNSDTREAREFGVVGPPDEQLKFTARELWLIDLPG